MSEHSSSSLSDPPSPKQDDLDLFSSDEAEQDDEEEEEEEKPRKRLIKKRRIEPPAKSKQTRPSSSKKAVAGATPNSPLSSSQQQEDDQPSAGQTPTEVPPPPPAKRKLGQIPKKGTPNTLAVPKNASATTPSQKEQAPTPSAPSAAAKPQQKGSTNDVDLRDESTYHRLFGITKSTSSAAKSGASTPRPSINISVHKEKSANRKAELRKLRDAEREARLNQSTDASLLYEQHFRITEQEDRLRSRNSAALMGPNILAGAFRNWSR